MKQCSIVVYCLAENINLKDIHAQVSTTFEIFRPEQLSLSCKISEHEQVCIFRFGAVAFVNIAEERHEELLQKLGLHTVNKARFESEEFVEDDCIVEFTEGPPRIQFNKILLPNWDARLLYISARVIAQSARLEILEHEVEAALAESAKLTKMVQTATWTRAKRKTIQQSLGRILNVRHDMINRLRLLHEPESTWESEDCDTLYKSLYVCYELERRSADVEKMLTLAAESAELQLGFLDTRRGEFLEIIIILLIAVEIVKTFSEALF